MIIGRGCRFAAAVVNNTWKFFYGLWLTQSFRAFDPDTIPPGQSDVNQLRLAPIVNYRFGKTGLYLQTTDVVALYNWNSGEYYLPIGFCFGKVWVWEKSSLNVYGKYKTSAIFKDWIGSAVKNSRRLNISYTIPIGL